MEEVLMSEYRETSRPTRRRGLFVSAFAGIALGTAVFISDLSVANAGSRQFSLPRVGPHISPRKYDPTTSDDSSFPQEDDHAAPAAAPAPLPSDHGSPHMSRRRSSAVQLINARLTKGRMFASKVAPAPEPAKEVDIVPREATGFWPPWPLNLIKNDASKFEGEEAEARGVSAGGYQKSAALFWRYFSHRAKIGARQLQQLGSDLSFHLPPAAPPLLLIALLPSKQKAADAAASATIVRSGAFARRVSLTSLGVAIISWAHYEIRQQKRLVPLPLKEHYKDFKRAILPPFLPEPVPPPELDPVLNNNDFSPVDDEAHLPDDLPEDDVLLDKGINPLSLERLKREFFYLSKAAPRPETFRSTLQALQKRRRVNWRETEEIRRKRIMDELIALQQLKKLSGKAPKAKKGNGSPAETGAPSLGYALVTGASRGIGRALAVELARWEIPLILVARNVDQLNLLADDIVACYGVPCCVLQADLSKSDAAAKIHRTTKEAGMRVDILALNAGVCTHGEMVETSMDDIDQMVQINAGSVAKLSHLYGKDMKRQRRGRILFVSSMVGAVSAGPGVAAYAATKSFEKTLALSMGKELEPHGVGVTCLMPGAVKDTAFRSTSNTDDAVCWKLPFYPRSAPEVAKRGIRALLEGDPEVCPGWQNKVFLRVVQPMLPQRLTTLIVEFVWNPFCPPWQHREEGVVSPVETLMPETPEVVSTVSSKTFSPAFWGSSTACTLQPRLLSLPVDDNPGSGKMEVGAADESHSTTEPIDFVEPIEKQPTTEPIDAVEPIEDQPTSVEPIEDSIPNSSGENFVESIDVEVVNQDFTAPSTEDTSSEEIMGGFGKTTPLPGADPAPGTIPAPESPVPSVEYPNDEELDLEIERFYDARIEESDISNELEAVQADNSIKLDVGESAAKEVPTVDTEGESGNEKIIFDWDLSYYLD